MLFVNLLCFVDIVEIVLCSGGFTLKCIQISWENVDYVTEIWFCPFLLWKNDSAILLEFFLGQFLKFATQIQLEQIDERRRLKFKKFCRKKNMLFSVEVLQLLYFLKILKNSSKLNNLNWSLVHPVWKLTGGSTGHMCLISTIFFQ